MKELSMYQMRQLMEEYNYTIYDRRGALSKIEKDCLKIESLDSMWGSETNMQATISLGKLAVTITANKDRLESRLGSIEMLYLLEDVEIVDYMKDIVKLDVFCNVIGGNSEFSILNGFGRYIYGDAWMLNSICLENERELCSLEVDSVLEIDAPETCFNLYVFNFRCNKKISFKKIYQDEEYGDYDIIVDTSHHTSDSQYVIHYTSNGDFNLPIRRVKSYDGWKDL